VRSYLNVGDLVSAQKYSLELKEMYHDHVNKRRMRHYYYAQALINLKQNKFDTAADSVIKAISLLRKDPSNAAHAIYFYTLAEIYYAKGDLDKAGEWFSKVINLQRGRIWTGRQYALSLYHLGKIYERKGDLDQSINYYQIFSDLWKEADFHCAELEDARKKKLK
jgi:tetratricopeptide (TPR) repeat protein